MIDPEEVTPPHVYFNRRTFMRAGISVGSVAATAALYRALNPTTLVPAKTQELVPSLSASPEAVPGAAANELSNPQPANNQQANNEQAAESPPTERPLSQEELIQKGFLVDEPKTPELYITNYNNFYEFTTSKEGVASAAANFKTDGWTIQVDGLVDKPTTLTIDQLQKLGPLEERIYRMRCVEGWSMVIPWLGVQLSHVLESVVPKSSARYVAFETFAGSAAHARPTQSDSRMALRRGPAFG